MPGVTAGSSGFGPVDAVCMHPLSHMTWECESGRVWTAGLNVALANVGVTTILLAF